MSDLILGPKDFISLSTDILRKGGTFRFRAGGGSMRPFIRDGAVLTVDPATPETLRLGDVVLYRSGNRPVAHRLLFKRNGSGNVEFIVRGDALSAPVERVPGDQVLGRVISVEQAGSKTVTESEFRRLCALSWAVIGLSIAPFLSPLRLARATSAKLLLAVQHLGPYRRLAMKLLAKEIRYRTAVARDAEELSRLFGYGTDADMSDPRSRVLDQIDGDDNSRCVLVATAKGKIVGAVSIQRLPSAVASGPDWWINDITVRLRYRGAGIGRGLLIKAGHKIRPEAGARLGGLTLVVNKQAVAVVRDLDGSEIDPNTFFRQLSQAVGEQADPAMIFYRSVEEGLTALEAAGVLKQYEGTGCCDAN
jgi:signal peptidase I